jgi:outer membrane protein
MSRNKLLVPALLAAMASSAHGAGLLDIYQAASERDPVYQSERFSSQAGQLQAPIARTAFKPSVDVSAGAGRTREDVEGGAFGSGTDTFNSASAGVGVNQTLFDRRSRIAIDQAENRGLVAGTQFQIAEEDLILRVVQRYLALLAAQDNLEVATREQVAIERQLELATERLEVGLGTRTDLYDAQARFRLAEAGVLAAENQIDDAREAIVELIGYDPGEVRKLREDAPLEDPDPADPQAWIERALSSNTFVDLAELNASIAEQEIDLQRAGRAPVVGVDLSHTYNDVSGGGSGTSSDRNVTDLMLQFSWPLYQGGVVPKRVEEAALNHNASLRDLESQRRSTARNARDAYLDVTTSISRVNALNQAVVASQSAVEARQEGFAAGLITNLDVLDAQRDFYSAIRDYLQERYDFILATLRLEQIVGDLDDEDVRRVDGWLEQP